MGGTKEMGSLWDPPKWGSTLQSAGGVIEKSGSEGCHLHLLFYSGKHRRKCVAVEQKVMFRFFEACCGNTVLSG